MNLPTWNSTPRQRAFLAVCTLASLALPPYVGAQTSPAASVDASALTKYDKNKNGRLDADELAAKQADDAKAAGAATASTEGATAAKDEETIVLSPFEVVSDNKGYMATNSASGTRLNSRLEDLASPISVVTKQQLMDMAAVDINDIFRSETNVEGFYQYTETGLDRNNLVDTVSNNPEANNRIRGMGQANLTANGMSISSAIPIDTYSVDSVEIARGANSNIFGIGSTSGTVNLNLATGNMTRDITKFSFMTDDLGRLRETFDINRVILRNKLAIRVLGAHDKLGFVREPSSSITKRFTIAARAQPFKKTSVKVSYETYRNDASLPNALTPRNAIPIWQAAGGYTWDPSNFTVYNSAGAAVGTYTGVQNPAAPALGSIALRNTYGFQGGDLDSANQRPIIGYIDGQVAYFTNTSAWRFTTRNATTQANTYVQTGDQRLVDYNYPAVQIYVKEIDPVTGQPFGLVPSAFAEQLEGIHGDAGKAFYDWTKYNLLAANHARRQSNVTRFELEQYLVNTPGQQLAFQLGAIYEDVENKSWNYIGNGGDGLQLIIYPDVNRKLPNGQPNPGYLRPMIRARQPQIYYRPEENMTNKFQMAYVSDFTRNDGWSKWLGKHNFVGYAEYRERRFSPGALRYRSMIPNIADTGAIRYPNTNSNADSLNTRYYLGDASGFNLDDPTTSPPTEGVFPFNYWSTEFGPTGATVLDTAQFRTINAKLAEVYFSQGTQKNETRTRGVLWQGYFLNGRIVPTIGYRKDKVRFVGSDSYARYTYTVDGYPSSIFTDPAAGLFDFADAYIVTNPRKGQNERVGQTRTQGVVVKPLQGLTRFSFLNGISLTYNRSASFEPAGLAIDTYGEIVEDPTGKSEDYGVRFSLLNERLWISINKYKAETINSRNNDSNVTAQRAVPFDVDTGDTNPDSEFGGLNSGTQLDLFDWYFWRMYGNTVITAPATTIPSPGSAGTGDLVYLAQKGLIGATDEETRQRVTDHIFGLMQYDKEIVRKRNNAPGAGTTSTNDVTSKGYEMEILYRTKNWNLKVTGAKKQTIDSNVAASLTKYIKDRMPVLQAASFTPLSGPNVGITESYWNTPSSGTTVTRGNQYIGNVLGVYAPLVANLGKPRPQIREYSVAVTTSYNLVGISDNKILKNMRVGGGATWVSKGSIGFGYKVPVRDPATGAIQINDKDVSKAYYDRARYTANAWASYDFRWYSGRIKSSLQVNVQNMLEGGRLQRAHVRTDGVADVYRIIDPRLFQLTINTEL